ncbi:unnamed protein product [Microthlaspi erraticum]|uniref:Rrn7/TAF1B N-terminal cyclin domain-containing protein n=1 Tax=Microthlaspi erraticum TaxID=1685480 RepID=A0A6D2KTZ9_9BRAS|nr:unnamed protein product [Microthlaspi erraticum]
MICTGCDSDKIEEGNDGFFYCLDCGVQAVDIIATAVNDEDLIGEGGTTRGAVYQHTNARRRPTHLMDTPAQPIHTEETIRYSQFRSQLQSAASLIPKFEPGAGSSVHVKQEPTEPADFGEAGAEGLSYEAYYKETRDRYVDGFLMMIMAQCDALVEKFNVTPLIIGLVGPISLRFVALSGVFDDDWADKSIHNSELQSQEGEDVKVEGREHKRRNRDRNGSEPRNFEGKRAVLIWTSQLRKSLPLSSSLAISFLVCHKARAPVLPTDIVRWVEEGSVPYRTCFLKIQEKMGARSAACPVEARIMFGVDEIISAQSLESRAASVADIIGLVLPPVDLNGIASNYLKRLDVSKEKVLDLVRRIQRWSMPSDLYLSKNKHRLPTRVCVMSILIVAIRMIYNINGFGVWERSLGGGLVDGDDVSEAEADSPVHDDDDDEVSERRSVDDAELPDVTEATEYETEELLKNLEMKYYEIAAETPVHKKDLLSFLSHGKNELFAGFEAASADDTYRNVDNLWNGYKKKNDDFEQFGTPSKRGRDWEDDLPFNQLNLSDDENLRDGNSPCASPAGRSESMDCDEPSLQRAPSSPENHNQEERSKERAISRLITDMADNFFVYIPPRVKVKRQGYLQYVRKKGDGELVYSAHADYYVLLRVCAQVAEIDARNLHRGVLSFERRLAWIEKRIDQVLHVTPPIVKCKLCKDEDEDEGLVT